MSRFFNILTCMLITFSLTTCGVMRKPADTAIRPDRPHVDREFRAAWVATVANINWPSRTGLSTDQQKYEAEVLLDLLKSLNFNAVIFQVRPQADALYPSDLEPWSYYLTGHQGRSPDPYYDPLDFWITEAHRRGLELHVWLNPYRAHHPSGGDITGSSVVRQYPDLVLRLKNGYWWFDPALKDTQDHASAVVRDIVGRYDIDGVHFDDYFYPYPSYNDNEDFPDDQSWNTYVRSGGSLSRDDWRRHNVNIFIRRIYQEIKSLKPHVKFGLSPFGIWRPGHPLSVRGFDQYSQLYADARLWLNEGWIDYFTPQLYWPIGQVPQSFPVLLDWWSRQNHMGRHLWPGISIGRYDGEKAAAETVNQIMVTRAMFPDHPGTVHWSIGPLMANPELRAALLNGPFKHQALVPPSPWLDDSPPAAPEVNVSLNRDSVLIQRRTDGIDDIAGWVVYAYFDGQQRYHIISGDRHSMTFLPYEINEGDIRQSDASDSTALFQSIRSLERIDVTSVDRAGNESPPRVIIPDADIREYQPSPEDILARPDAAHRVSPVSEGMDTGSPLFPDRIYHLVRCDDMGMSHSVNMAVEKVIQTGIPLSVSVMFTCPWYQEAVEILKANPQVSAGVHLTLNSEWKNYRWGPVLGASAVPSLVDSAGYFFPSRQAFFANNPGRDEIEMELRAQIQRALNSGIRIDYLDTHMGTAVQTPELRQVVEQLADEYGLGLSGYFGERFSYVTYHEPVGDKTMRLLHHMRSLGPGINVQVLHVGLNEPELRALEDMNPGGLSQMSRHRQAELNSILFPSVHDLWETHPIQPVTYRQVIEAAGLDSMRRPEENGY